MYRDCGVEGYHCTARRALYAVIVYALVNARDESDHACLDRVSPFRLTPLTHQRIRISLNHHREDSTIEDLGVESSQQLYSQESKAKIRTDQGIPGQKRRESATRDLKLAPGVGFEPTRPARTTG